MIQEKINRNVKQMLFVMYEQKLKKQTMNIVFSVLFAQLTSLNEYLTLDIELLKVYRFKNHKFSLPNCFCLHMPPV